jgi:hypothetical protein
MNSKRMFQIALIGFISIFFISFGWASSSARTFVLEATPDHPDANGTAVIDATHVSIQARDLKPDAVYTVWFVNMKPKKKAIGAGTMPYMFRTDKWGGGNYSASLSKTPFGKWAMVMVVLHPNGDPKDMNNMVGALKAPL